MALAAPAARQGRRLLFLKPISYTGLMVARPGCLLWAQLIPACGPSKHAKALGDEDKLGQRLNPELLH
jgi:hypothetical protein